LKKKFIKMVLKETGIKWLSFQCSKYTLIL
jgi:hypothetical protein